MHFQCPSWTSKFTRIRNLLKHFTTEHNDYSNDEITRFICGQMFKNNIYLDEHNKRYHKPSKCFEVRESAFQKAAVCYRYSYNICDSKNMITPAEAQDNIMKDEIRKIIHHEISQKNVVKFSIILIAQMVTNDDTKASIPFRSKSYTATAIEKENIKKKIESAMLEQSNKIEDFFNKGSCWFYETAIAIDVEVVGVI